MPVKNSDRTPGEKLLALYTLFMYKSDKHMSLTELARYLECSKQTVLRLLDQLEAAGYGKLDEPLRKGRENFYRMRTTNVKNFNIGPEELFKLEFCRKMLLALLPKSIGSLVLKDSGECGKDEMEDENAGTSSLVYTKGLIDYTPFQEQYHLLMAALRKRQICIVDYKKHPCQPVRTFSFAPIRLITYHEAIFFMGWEVNDKGKAEKLYEKPLVLSLQRCHKIMNTSRSSARLPAPENIGQYGFGIMQGNSFNARVLFNSEAAPYVNDRQWSSKQKIELLEDGRLILELVTQSKPEFVSWILSFGTTAKVLEPEWLREEVVAKAKSILENYHSDKPTLHENPAN